MELFKYLSENDYPGRGILMGNGENGSIIAYFIMGRSENSRNRVFIPTSDGIRTRAYDESKCVDPSLIIYAPVRKFGAKTIVTNGDQTDTICAALSLGGSFESALMTRSFEPDAPNFTPRISGVIENGAYKLSILKSETGDGGACLRAFYSYEPEACACHLIHTYEHDGSPIPSYKGEPKRFTLPQMPIGQFAGELWSALNSDNRVSLFVRYIGAGGHEDTVIINKHTTD